MAFTNVIRRAASGSQRYYHHKSWSTLFSTAAPNTSSTPALSQKLFRCSFSRAIQPRYPRKGNRLRQPTTATTRRQYDDTLVKVIDSQIHCAGDSHDNHKAEDVPESFPFKIVDEQGRQTVTLTRNDHGESITVEVHMPSLIAGDEDKKDSESYNHPKLDKKDSESYNHPKLHMVVRVSKNVGACFEFGVSAYSDIIEIETLSIKDPKAGEDEIAYAGPDFGDLDENLQKAFYKYLDIRGINHRSTNFLHEYMTNKDTKEYVGWLKKAKKFVEAYANNDDNKNNVPLDVNLEKAKRFVEADADNDDNKNNVLVGDNLESWTAHKIKLLYFYNASTGESTYEKPAGFKVETEPDRDNLEGDGDYSEAWITRRIDLVYYYNALTGESTYEKPVGFKAMMEPVCDNSEGGNPEAWMIQRTKSGSLYYYNALTGESTYEKPLGFKDKTGQVGELEASASHEVGSAYYYKASTGESTLNEPDGPYRESEKEVG